jgi:hypothetical protein
MAASLHSDRTDASLGAMQQDGTGVGNLSRGKGFAAVAFPGPASLFRPPLLATRLASLSYSPRHLRLVLPRLAGALRLEPFQHGGAFVDDCPSNGAALIDAQDQQWAEIALGAGLKPDFVCLKNRHGDKRVGYVSFEVPKKARLRTF